MSIFSSLRYCLGDPSAMGNVWMALAFLPFGLFFDFFDGKVARWRKKSSLMGQELDSLADLVRWASSISPAPAPPVTRASCHGMAVNASTAEGSKRRDGN